MKRVLLITYFFPPEGGAGTQRGAKFAKYLPDFGWEPTVLTRLPNADVEICHREDQSLLGDIAEKLFVLRVPAKGAPRFWARSAPDLREGCLTWLEPAMEVARDVIARGRIDAVVVTMSPFELSALGLHIREELGVPVILDLRDPWAIDGWRLRGSYFRWLTDWRAMAKALPEADGVIANTNEARLELLRRVPGLDSARVMTIPNGYDEQDFASPSMSRRRLGDGTMRICHLGTLHTQGLYKYEGVLGPIKKLKHYRPEPIDVAGRTEFFLLRALRMLRDRGDARVNRVRVSLVGEISDATRRCVGESGVGDLVELTGYVSHSEAVRRLVDADVLFTPLHGLPPGRRSLIVPGKLYECLRSGRPILGCLPEGEARELVQRSENSLCADPCDAQAIAGAISTFLDRHERRQLSAVSPATWLRGFERRSLTQRLAGFLDRVSTRSARATAHAAPPKRLQQPALAQN